MSTVQQVENAALTAMTGSKTEGTDTAQKKNRVYGRVIGAPELSDKGKEYYEELKKKYSNMDFVLVSSDMKEMARAQAGSYANPYRLVVLIDEEKIERMATDEDFRKQYEAVISSASVKMAQMKSSLGSNASCVKSFGMQVNDGGNASFFAVVDKSLAAQRDRIKKKGEEKAAQKKADAKKAEKKKAEERTEAKRSEKSSSDEVTVTASSLDELLRKINDVVYESMSDYAQTEEERMVGQHFDFRF